MSESSTKYLRIIGCFIILLSIVIFVTSLAFDLNPFASISLFLLGLLFIMANADGDISCESAAMTRNTALAKALVPGWGDIYLGKKLKGLLILGFFFFSIVLMILPFIVGETVVACLIYAIPMLLFSLVYSSIDATELCDKMKLPFTGGIFELHIKNTTLAKSLTFLIFSITLLLMDPYLRHEFTGYDFRQFWIADICAVIFLIYSVYLYLKNYKNQKTC